MIPGSAVALNVALNSRQYSTDMCGKLLYVRVTNSGCTRCGTTQMPEGYMLARVTNECPECLFGSLDFGMKGDGRCRLTSTFPPQSLRHLCSLYEYPCAQREAQQWLKYAKLKQRNVGCMTDFNMRLLRDL